MDEGPSSSVTLLCIVQCGERVNANDSKVRKEARVYWDGYSVSIEMGGPASPNHHVEVVARGVQLLPGLQASRTVGIYRRSIRSQVAGSRGGSPGGKSGVE